jgi:hypothetical protein
MRMFAASAFAESPATFQAYLAFDASLSWDMGAVIDKVGVTLAERTGRRDVAPVECSRDARLSAVEPVAETPHGSQLLAPVA